MEAPRGVHWVRHLPSFRMSTPCLRLTRPQSSAMSISPFLLPAPGVAVGLILSRWREVAPTPWRCTKDCRPDATG